MLSNLVKFQKQNKLSTAQVFAFCSSQKQDAPKKKAPKVLFGNFKTKSKQFPERNMKDSRNIDENDLDDFQGRGGEQTYKTFRFGQNNDNQRKGGNYQSNYNKGMGNQYGNQQAQKQSAQMQGQFLSMMAKEEGELANQEDKKQEIQESINKFESLEKTKESIQSLMDLYSLLHKPEMVIQLYNEYQEKQFEQNEGIDNLMFINSVKLDLQKGKEFLDTVLIPKNRLNLIYRHNVNSYIETIIQQQNKNKEEISLELGEFLDLLLKEEVQVEIDINVFATLIQNLSSSEIIQTLETFLNYFNYVNNQSPQQQQVQQQQLKQQQQQQSKESNKQDKNQQQQQQQLIRNPYYLLNLDHVFKTLVQHQNSQINMITPKVQVKESSKQRQLSEIDINLHFFETCQKAGVSLNYENISTWLSNYLYRGQEGLAMVLRVSKNIITKAQQQQTNQTFGQNQGHNKGGKAAKMEQDQTFYSVFSNKLDEFYEKTLQHPFSAQILEKQFKLEQEVSQYLSINSVMILQNLAKKHNAQNLVFLLYSNFEKLRTPATYENLINTILQSELEDNNYRQTIQTIQQEAKNSNIIISNQFKSISDVKAQILESYHQDSVQIFNEYFINPNQVQHYKLKIKYFLMNLMQQQDVSVEYQISQSFINKYVNQIPNGLIQKLIQEDSSMNNFIKQILGHRESEGSNLSHEENMHNLRKQEDLSEQFLAVRRKVTNNELSVEDLPKLRLKADQLHGNEIYILENYEQMDKQYIKQQNLKKYMDDIHLLKETYNNTIAVTAPSNQKMITEQHEKELDELKILVNKLLERDEDTSIDAEYKQSQRRRSTKQLQKLLDLLKNQDKKNYRMKFMDGETLQEAIFVHEKLYDDADLSVYIRQNQNQINLVNEFCQWGIKQNQPLAVYLTEKYYFTLGQQIPEYLSKNIEKFLVQIAFNDNKVADRQKMALNLVQSVERSKIYDLSKGYKHVKMNEYENEVVQQYIKENPQDRFQAQFLNFQDKSVNRYYKYGIPSNLIFEQQNVAV